MAAGSARSWSGPTTARHPRRSPQSWAFTQPRCVPHSETLGRRCGGCARIAVSEMTKDQIPSTGPDGVERREYAVFVDSLTGVLDLCGGLGEALNVADYTTISSDIANLL